jgi:hypothetical protein
MTTEPWAELGEAVAVIRSQLQEAMDQGAGQRLRFRTGPVELEFSVTIRKDAEAKAKVFVLPWSAEVRGALGAEGVHRIKLVLEPVDASGDDVLIADQSFKRPT